MEGTGEMAGEEGYRESRRRAGGERIGGGGKRGYNLSERGGTH